MSETARRSPAFEVEAGSIEEFFQLLEMREGQRAHGALPVVEPVPRRALFIEQLHDRHHGAVGGLPMVRRYVVAAFCYGEDLVSYALDTSRDIEGPNFPNSERHQERQQEAYDELRSDLEERLRSRGLDEHVPILRAFIHHSSNPRERDQ